MSWAGRCTRNKDENVNRRAWIGLLVLISLGLGMSFVPSRSVAAQDCGVPDSTGAVTPCPPESGGGQEGGVIRKRTATPLPPTFTHTPTNTATSTPSKTPTATATSTATFIPDTATPSVTPTAALTSTPTPVPLTQSVLPGAGIGALILFLILGLLLPAIQKLRVLKRGY